MTRERLIGLAIGAATVIITLILLALFETHSQSAPLCTDQETRERIRALSLQGFDDALKTHMQHLFEIWMKDASDQPKRAQVGAQQGFSAYTRARGAALRWNPPLC